MSCAYSSEIDECSKDTDNCTHVCVNTEGSYYCTCPSGYELKSDNNTCVGESISSCIQTYVQKNIRRTVWVKVTQFSTNLFLT